MPPTKRSRPSKGENSSKKEIPAGANYNESDLDSGSGDDSDLDDSDDETYGLRTAKERFNTRVRQSEVLAASKEVDESGESTDESESEDQDDSVEEDTTKSVSREELAQMEIEQLTDKGPLGDVYPYGGDEDGSRGYRCVHCPSKRMQSDQDVVIHLQSKAHRRKFKAVLAAKRAALVEARKILPPRIQAKKAKKEARIAANKEKKKKQLAEKRKNLTPEQIEHLKQKRAAKTERRNKRKFGDSAIPVAELKAKNAATNNPESSDKKKKKRRESKRVKATK